MKLALHLQHHNFFRRCGFLEFEGILEDKKIEIVKESLTRELSQRLKLGSKKVSEANQEKLYYHGYDLWRALPELKKIACSKNFAKIASELMRDQPLWIAFDQTLFSGEYLENLPQTLEEMSSFQTLSGGLLICLDPGKDLENHQHEGEEESGDEIYLPQSRGSALFFSPEHKLNWKETHPDSCYYLIAYGNKRSSYVYNDKDIHTHRLKTEGYVYGDKLKDSYHPVVYR